MIWRVKNRKSLQSEEEMYRRKDFEYWSVLNTQFSFSGLIIFLSEKNIK
jgi:hypothetical protein